MNKNITIYRPKRKYNRPRYAKAIGPNETFTYTDVDICVQVTNTSDKTVYLRKDWLK